MIAGSYILTFPFSPIFLPFTCVLSLSTADTARQYKDLYFKEDANVFFSCGMERMPWRQQSPAINLNHDDLWGSISCETLSKNIVCWALFIWENKTAETRLFFRNPCFFLGKTPIGDGKRSAEVSPVNETNDINNLILCKFPETSYRGPEPIPRERNRMCAQGICSRWHHMGIQSFHDQQDN